MEPFQMTLPMSPPNSVPIGDTGISFVDEGDRRVYYAHLQGFDSHKLSNRGAQLLRIAQFAALEYDTGDLVRAFGVTPSTVRRALKRFREVGEPGWFAPRYGRR